MGEMQEQADALQAAAESMLSATRHNKHLKAALAHSRDDDSGGGGHLSLEHLTGRDLDKTKAELVAELSQVRAAEG